MPCPNTYLLHSKSHLPCPTCPQPTLPLSPPIPWTHCYESSNYQCWEVVLVYQLINLRLWKKRAITLTWSVFHDDYAHVHLCPYLNIELTNEKMLVVSLLSDDNRRTEWIRVTNFTSSLPQPWAITKQVPLTLPIFSHPPFPSPSPPPILGNEESVI